MDTILAGYGPFQIARALSRVMAYTVTFYALPSGLAEIVVTMHRVERGGLVAYTATPAVAHCGGSDRQGRP